MMPRELIATGLNTATEYLFTSVSLSFAGRTGSPSSCVVREQDLDEPRGDVDRRGMTDRDDNETGE
jgi:hypothetical protein